MDEQLYYKQALVRVKEAEQFKADEYINNVMKITSKQKNERFLIKRKRMLKKLKNKVIKNMQMTVPKNQIVKNKVQAVQLINMMRSDNVDEVTQLTSCKYNIYLFLIYLSTHLNTKIQSTTIRINRYSFLVEVLQLWYQLGRVWDPNKQIQFQNERKILENIQDYLLNKFTKYWNKQLFQDKRKYIIEEISRVILNREEYYKNYVEVHKKEVPTTGQGVHPDYDAFQPTSVLRRFIAIEQQFMDYLKTVETQIVMIPTIAADQDGKLINIISIPQIMEKVLDKISSQTKYCKKWLEKVKDKKIKQTFTNCNIKPDFIQQVWDAIMLITCILRAGHVMQLDLLRQLYQPKLSIPLPQKDIPYYVRDIDIATPYIRKQYTDTDTQQLIKQASTTDIVLYKQLQMKNDLQKSDNRVLSNDSQLSLTLVPYQAKKRQSMNDQDDQTDLIGIQQQLQLGLIQKPALQLWSLKKWNNLQDKNSATFSQSLKFCYKIYYVFINVDIRLTQNIYINNFILPKQYLALQQQIKNIDKIRPQFNQMNQSMQKQLLAQNEVKQMSKVLIEKSKQTISKIDAGVTEMAQWNEIHNKKLEQINNKLGNLNSRDIKTEIYEALAQIAYAKQNNQMPNFRLLNNNLLALQGLDDIKSSTDSISLMNSYLIDKGISVDWGVKLMQNLGYDQLAIQNTLTRDKKQQYQQFYKRNGNYILMIQQYLAIQMNVCQIDQTFIAPVLRQIQTENAQRYQYIKEQLADMKIGINKIDKTTTQTLNEIIQLKRNLQTKYQNSVHNKNIPVQQLIYLKGKIDTISMNWDGIKQYVQANKNKSSQQLKQLVTNALQVSLQQHFQDNITLIVQKIKSYGIEHHRAQIQAIQQVSKFMGMGMELLYKNNIQNTSQVINKLSSNFQTLKSYMQNLQNKNAFQADLDLQSFKKLQYAATNIFGLIQTCYAQSKKNGDVQSEKLLKKMVNEMKKINSQTIQSGSENLQRIWKNMKSGLNDIQLNNIQNINQIRNQLAGMYQKGLESAKDISHSIDKSKLQMTKQIADQFARVRQQLRDHNEIQNELKAEKMKYINVQSILQRASRIVGTEPQNLPLKLTERQAQFQRQKKYIKQIQILLQTSGDQYSVIAKVAQMKKISQSNFQMKNLLENSVKQKQNSIENIEKIKNQITQKQHKNELQKKDFQVQKQRLRQQLQRNFDNERNSLKQTLTMLKVQKQKYFNQLNKLSLQLEKWKLKSQSLQSSNKELQANMAAKTYNRANDQEIKIKESEAKYYAMYQQKAEITGKLQRVSQQINRLKALQASLQQRLINSTRLHSQQITKLNNEINNQRNQLIAKKSQLNHMNQKLNLAEVNVSKLNIQITNMKAIKQNDKELSKKKIKQLTQQKQNLQKNLRKQMEKYKSQNIQYQKQLQAVEEKIRASKKMNDKIKELQEQNMEIKRKNQRQNLKYQQRQEMNREISKKNQRINTLERELDESKNQLYKQQISKTEKKDLQKIKNQIQVVKNQKESTLKKYEDLKQKAQIERLKGENERKSLENDILKVKEQLTTKTGQLVNLKKKVQQNSSLLQQKEKIISEINNNLMQGIQSKKKLVASNKEKIDKIQQKSKQLELQIQEKNKEIKNLIELSEKNATEKKKQLKETNQKQSKYKQKLAKYEQELQIKEKLYSQTLSKKQKQFKDKQKERIKQIQIINNKHQQAMQNHQRNIKKLTQQLKLAAQNPSKKQILNIIGNPPNNQDVQTWIIKQIANKKQQLQNRTKQLNQLKGLQAEKSEINKRKIKQNEQKIQSLILDRNQLQIKLKENQEKMNQIKRKQLQTGSQLLNVTELLKKKNDELVEMQKSLEGFKKLHEQTSAKIQQLEKQLKKSLNDSSEQKLRMNELEKKLKQKQQLEKKMNLMDPQKHQNEINAMKKQLWKAEDNIKKLRNIQKIRSTTLQKLAGMLQRLAQQQDTLTQTRRLFQIQHADGNLNEIQTFKMVMIQNQLETYEKMMTQVIRKYQIQRQNVKGNNVKGFNDPKQPFSQDLDVTRREQQKILRNINQNQNQKKINKQEDLNRSIQDVQDVLEVLDSNQAQKIRIFKQTINIEPIQKKQDVLVKKYNMIGSTKKKRDALSLSEQLENLKNQYFSMQEKHNNVEAQLNLEKEKNHKLIKQEAIMIQLIIQMFEILIKILMQISKDATYCLKIAEQFTALSQKTQGLDQQVCKTVAKVMVGIQKGLKSIEQAIVNPLAAHKLLQKNGKVLQQNFQKIKNSIKTKKHQMFK